jgi:hypothetical protein
MLAVPLLLTFDDPIQGFVAAVLLVSAGYALLRKRLASLAESFASVVPTTLRPYLPERFRVGSEVVPQGRRATNGFGWSVVGGRSSGGGSSVGRRSPTTDSRPASTRTLFSDTKFVPPLTERRTKLPLVVLSP